MKTSLPAHFIPRLLGSLALTAALVPTVHAADAATTTVTSASSDTGGATGPYVGLSLGSSKLGPRPEGADGAHGHPNGTAKLYGGFRLTETWGVEAGWAQLGRVHNDTTAADGSVVHHNGQARSLYLAGTARVALGQGVSLTGKAGVAFGRVSAVDPGDTQFTLGGSQVAPLLGIGAEYQVNRHIAVTLDLDGYGKVSDKVKASTATLGVRYGF